MLEPVTQDGRATSAAVPIRIASASGNPVLKTIDNIESSGHLLWGGLAKNRARKYNTEMWANDYHTYELIWSQRRIILKVDGQLYGDKQITLPADTPVL